VAAALWYAACWPFTLAWRLLTSAARLAGRGVTTAVSRTTPLTQPELERRIAEQQREIARLSAQLAEDSRTWG
jgi:hypothetical protein